MTWKSSCCDDKVITTNHENGDVKIYVCMKCGEQCDCVNKKKSWEK